MQFSPVADIVVVVVVKETTATVRRDEDRGGPREMHAVVILFH